MTAILGTLFFLATLWLLVVLGAAVLDENGAKIASALKGHSAQLPPAVRVPVRVRKVVEARRSRFALEPLRAAA